MYNSEQMKEKHCLSVFTLEKEWVSFVFLLCQNYGGEVKVLSINISLRVIIIVFIPVNSPASTHCLLAASEAVLPLRLPGTVLRSGLLYCTPFDESKLQPKSTNQLDIGVRPQAWQLQASQSLTAADDFTEISLTIGR